MSWPQWLAVSTAFLIALSLTACGGDSRESTTAPPHAPAAVLAKANAICRDFLRETRQLGRGALANPPSTALELTTERLVKPSIPLLEGAGRRMQVLVPAAHDPLFALYANLFDPAVVLAQKRLAAGRAGDFVKSKELEESLSSIGLEQRRAARILHLPDCDVDYQNVLLHSLTE
jgi:hypothetical protein